MGPSNRPLPISERLTMEHIAILGETIAGRAATVRKQMASLSTDLQRNTFDIAELALEAQEHGYFREWGYDSFGEYGEQELGIRHRKLQYLARICKVTKACGIQRADYQPAGITKLRSICSLDPDTSYFNTETKLHEDMAEHITALIAEAPELDTKEVEERVAHLKGLDGDNAMLTKSYSVTKSAYESTVKRCFEAVRMRLGSAGRDDTGAAREYTDGNVIEALCAEFLSDPRNFLEESDESQVQIELPEETNVRTTGAPLSMAESETEKDTLLPSGDIEPSDEHSGSL
jgi:hypothetical protein